MNHEALLQAVRKPNLIKVATSVAGTTATRVNHVEMTMGRSPPSAADPGDHQVIPSEAVANPHAVLVVDDEPLIRLLWEEVVADLGLRSISVTNGQEAHDLLRTNQAWSAVILDWQMPIMDGSDLIQNTGAILAAARIPVLVVSGLPSAVRREMPTIPGLIWTVEPKPFRLERIGSVLRDLIQERSI